MESMTYIQFPFPCLMVQLLPEPIVRCATIFPLSANDSQRHELSTISGAGKAEGGIFMYGCGLG